MDDHIRIMAKPSNREKILTQGLRVVHERGFAGASVRDIVQAAGVPQGSFTNHFASKEAFGLEVIELYLAAGREVMRDTLLNDALPPARWRDQAIAAVARSSSAAASSQSASAASISLRTAPSLDCAAATSPPRPAA